ncbi:ATP-binding protein [Pararhizobium sp. LjRoot255]|uniref:AAA family ATPase n=1 Tax=Pararhizobium sp. LjRoot255 TaxID=3342298 RepID=UPI003ED0AE34
MDKVARLFVSRLRHSPAARRVLRNGLLEGKIVDVDGHLLCRYSPAFDTGALTGYPARDRDWFRRCFGAGLVAPKEASSVTSGIGGDVVVTMETVDEKRASPLVAFPRKRRGTAVQNAALGTGVDRRAYAVGLVGRAADAPLVSHVVAALVLARSVAKETKPLRDIIRTVAHAPPVITLNAPLAGFEREVLRLLQTSGLVPGSPFAIVDADQMFDDSHFDIYEGESRKRLVVFQGEAAHRVTGKSLRRRVIGALSRDFPILTNAEKRSAIPAMLQISADLPLETGKLDRQFVGDLVEALYPGTLVDDEDLPADGDARWLSLDDLILAFRPGRDLGEALSVLAVLVEYNRKDAEDEDGGDAGDIATTSGSKGSGSKSLAASPERAAGSDEKPKPSDSENNGRWKRDKPSGAEVIQPEPLPSAAEIGHKPPVTVETLSGYGKAKDWALDLKADLDDYQASVLTWSEMSTKLLLSGPPGTGKTTFARALCNSLQIPLVVTSVSTWLQGGHLNDVIDKMSKTFIEARAMAPAILFIDEIDGIGKRQPAEREYADYWNAVVNKALELLDGAVKSEGLIIVGATNRPDDIDEALKRSGRLETHIEIPKPDVATLAEILVHHLGDDVLSLVRKTIQDMALNPEGPRGDEEPSLDGDPLISNPQQDDVPEREEGPGEHAVERKGTSL